VGTDTLRVGNLLGPSGECSSSEIVVFSPDRAMYIGQLHPDWTDKSEETREIKLPDTLLRLPVKFWILYKPEGTTISTLMRDLQGELKLANQLFGPKNQCGIEFVATEDSFKDKTIDAKNKGLSGYTCNGNDDIKFNDEHWKDSSAINVYFVSEVTHKASHCGLGIFLSERRTPESLAHEIGHDLGLEDALFEIDELTKIRLGGLSRAELENWGLAQENLMFSGGVKRTELTKGQCFRCYMNESSKVRTLVKQLDPWGKTRDCRGPKSNCIDIGSIVTTPQ
jgi:hypothetical protein